MPFVKAKRSTAATPIGLTVRGDDGKPAQIAFTAKYRRHSLEDLIDLNDMIQNKSRLAAGLSPLLKPDGSAVPAWPYPSDMAFIEEVLIGWHDVADGDGAAVAFSLGELRATVSDYPELVIPLFNGFFEAHQAVPQVKN
ncbi:Uncharacterised protein [Bordetella ansorpii]|uniref:Phage protein n=1 Tax=Bordetella ansorpii TaxID=288768 RepID=A0A157RLR6_9BORD|nr:hypothetical protein [Bordetella ansorpii]SAI58918.1 Uncharacterised protein [Bordetella ansorpii]